MADDPKPPAGSRDVPLHIPGMGVRMVAAHDAPQALRDGARFATEPEYKDAKLEARYGGYENILPAAGYGAVRGLGGAFGVPHG